MKKIGVLGALVLASSYTMSSQLLPDQPKFPKDNQITLYKVDLGRTLFFDNRLSKNGKVSCNSCHDVMGNGASSLPTSNRVDGKLGGRNVPTLWNAAYSSVQYWDGRAPTLEAQAKNSLIHPEEMGMENHDKVIAKLKKIKGYAPLFKKAFGVGDVININHVAKAISTFVRTLTTPNSPFDRYMLGDKKAMNPSQIRGYQIFQTAGCVACHMGINFAGPELPVGSAFFQKFPTFPNHPSNQKYGFEKDLGRYNVTKKEVDKNMWRVSTLRNIAITAPYFHNGAVSSLEEAIRVMGTLQLNRSFKDNEVKDLVAFMNALTGERLKINPPAMPQ